MVAAIHGISATGASSIIFLAVLWAFVPAPAVFLWLQLAPGTGGRWRLPSRVYLSLAAVLSLLVLVGVGWIGAERAIHPKPCSDVPDLADYPALQPVAERVSFQVPEGNRRVGWFIPGQSRATVLLLHGYACRRQEMLDYAQVLHQAGYSTMLFDFRNRGESDGDAVTLGFYERQDAVAAVEYLRTRSEVDLQRLGVLGISMGAAVAILAAAQAPEIKAVIADSSFESASRAVEEGFTRVTDLPAFPFSPVALLIIRLRLGISASDVVPRDHIAAISPRPVFLVHGLADTKVTPGNSENLFAVAGEPKEIWRLPGSQHTDGIKDYREEYSRRMVEFFDKYLMLQWR
jgi:fermentation-respiration switch protein FrsA (DUF1100 family)